MKKALFVLILTVTPLFSSAFAGQVEQIEIEKAAREEKPSFEEGREAKVYFDSEYEYSWIKQASRKGHWRILTNRIAYLNNNFQQPYLDITTQDRFSVKDYTFDVGSYFKIDKGYIQGGVGFGGADLDFLYKFKSFLEIEHQLVNHLFFNAEAKYLHYSSGDVTIFSPGLVYYFNDDYLSATYGVSFTQDRGDAHFGIIQGNFSVNKYMRFWLGTAIGERLYDIFPLEASKQYGYIFFSGADINISKNVILRISGSYSKEQPSFIKRSINAGLAIKF